MPSDRQPFRFGIFEVNLATGDLRRNGAKVKLQEQPFQVLAAMLEKPGEIVTKEELQERIWKDDTFVDFDRSLATAINKVRQALGDSATRPRFIETVPKRGYRFVGLGADTVTPPAPKPTMARIPWKALTSAPGADRYPSISANGSTVTFQTDRTGSREQWVLNTVDGGQRWPPSRQCRRNPTCHRIGG